MKVIKRCFCFLAVTTAVVISTIFDLTSFPMLTIVAEAAETYGDYEYTTSDSGATITKYKGSESAVSIPSTIAGYGVYEIGSSAFSNCTALKNITFSDSIESIESSAFSGCTALESITFSDSIESIGDAAFEGCTALESIKFSDSIESIGNYAFWDCTVLGSIEFSDSIESIGDFAFCGCTALESITFSDSIKSIGSSAFSGCNNLKNVSLPNNIETMGLNVFTSPYITSITIPKSMKTMRWNHSSAYGYYSAFIGCKNLETVEFESGMTKIPGGALYYCESVSNITIPESVTEIGYGAISGDDKLTIYGYADSYAQTFASEHSIPFVVLEDEEVDPETTIAIFSTEKSLTVQTGSSMWLGFGKISGGQLADDWSKMAIVVSDPTVISLSDYEETEYGYSLEVTGNKQGATNVTITDTESGASTIIVITVRDSYVSTYSYAIDRMESFYPENEWEKNIQTNIYNLNGLYVNNYHESKEGDTYTVSFDVYNSQYHTGAVDIYDADGNWIDCEEVKKFSMISSLWDTGKQAYYLISNAVTGKLLTYEQASFAEHTPISIEVPEGGYFTISNNFAESPGTFLFNSCDILYDGTCTLIDAALDVKNDKVALSAFSDLVKDKITKDKTIREQFMEIFEKTAKKEVQKCMKKFATNEIDDRYADISGLFENLLNSLDISWKHLFKSATGVVESAFTKFAGPAGVALKGCFAITKGGNQLVQAVHLAASIDAPYVTVFSSISEGEINPHGVIVNTNGNMDAEAVLQVFRVSNNSTIEDVLDGDSDQLKKYELYNISFVKDDQLVQPSGKVTVRIPIPDGMKGDTCNVYRQETDGSWTILTAYVEGNYLVFETNHFSLYGVVGEVDDLSVSSLPSKTQYNVGDTLDASGLVLSLGGKEITSGFVCEPTVLSQEGEQEITVQVGLASTKFRISVNTTPLDFTDVVAGAWYEKAVKYVVENGLMSGYGNKKFGPNDSLTRAQFAQILYNKEGKPTIEAKSEFNDVPDNAWYYDAVTWVVDNGVASGYGNGKFGSDDNITREQLAVMLWRYAGKPESSHSLTQFSDESKISAYAKNALAWANENGIMNGKGDGILDPLGKATRAEVGSMLMRYCENVQKGE